MTSQVPLALNVRDTLTCLPSKREKDNKDTSVGKHLSGKGEHSVRCPSEANGQPRGLRSLQLMSRGIDSPRLQPPSAVTTRAPAFPGGCSHVRPFTHPCSQGLVHSLLRRSKHGLFSLLLAFIMVLPQADQLSLLYLFSRSSRTISYAFF